MDWDKWRELNKSYPLDMDMWLFFQDKNMREYRESPPLGADAFQERVAIIRSQISELSPEELERKLLEDHQMGNTFKEFADFYLGLAKEEEKADLKSAYIKHSEKYRSRWAESLAFQCAILEELDAQEGRLSEK